MHDDIDNVDNDEDGDVTVEWMDEGVDCLASALAGQSVTAYIRNEKLGNWSQITRIFFLPNIIYCTEVTEIQNHNTEIV